MPYYKVTWAVTVQAKDKANAVEVAREALARHRSQAEVDYQLVGTPTHVVYETPPDHCPACNAPNRA